MSNQGMNKFFIYAFFLALIETGCSYNWSSPQVWIDTISLPQAGIAPAHHILGPYVAGETVVVTARRDSGDGSSVPLKPFGKDEKIAFVRPYVSKISPQRESGSVLTDGGPGQLEVLFWLQNVQILDDGFTATGQLPILDDATVKIITDDNLELRVEPYTSSEELEEINRNDRAVFNIEKKRFFNAPRVALKLIAAATNPDMPLGMEVLGGFCSGTNVTLAAYSDGPAFREDFKDFGDLAPLLIRPFPSKPRIVFLDASTQNRVFELSDVTASGPWEVSGTIPSIDVSHYGAILSSRLFVEVLDEQNNVVSWNGQLRGVQQDNVYFDTQNPISGIGQTFRGPMTWPWLVGIDGLYSLHNFSISSMDLQRGQTLALYAMSAPRGVVKLFEEGQQVSFVTRFDFLFENTCYRTVDLGNFKELLRVNLKISQMDPKKATVEIPPNNVQWNHVALLILSKQNTIDSWFGSPASIDIRDSVKTPCGL